MDINKVSLDCKKCIHRKQTMLERISALDNEDIGAIFMRISAIIACIVLFIMVQPMFGLLPTILMSCVVIFTIGFFMYISY